MDEYGRQLQRKADDPVRELLYKERTGQISSTFIKAAAIIDHPIASNLYPEFASEDCSWKTSNYNSNFFKAFEFILTEGSVRDAKQLFKAIWRHEVEESLSQIVTLYQEPNLQNWNHFDKLKRWLDTDETNSLTMLQVFSYNSQFLHMLEEVMTPAEVYARDILSLFNAAVRSYCISFSEVPPYTRHAREIWGNWNITQNLGDSAHDLEMCWQVKNTPPCTEYAVTAKVMKRCITLRMFEFFEQFGIPFSSL